MASDSTERILSGRSWEDFCDRLRDAGEVVLRDATPMDAFDRAEGYRYLSRLTRVALESYIEAADPRAPVLRRPSHESVKIGADNPDNHYQSAAISGAYEYRLSGTRGTVHYLGFGTYAGNYGSDARMGQSGYLEAADIEIGPDHLREIDFVDYQQVRLGDTGSAFAGDFVAAGYVDHVNGVVDQLLAEMRREVVAAALDKEQV